MQAGPDIGGGIQELMNQFMMMKMIQQMYPGKSKEELSTSPLPKKRDVREIFHSLGLNPGDETEAQFDYTTGVKKPEGILGQALQSLGILPWASALGFLTSAPSMISAGVPVGAASWGNPHVMRFIDYINNSYGKR